jgi:hypothetical protein
MSRQPLHLEAKRHGNVRFWHFWDLTGPGWRRLFLRVERTTQLRTQTSEFDPSRKLSTLLAVTYEATTLPSGRAKFSSG